VEKALTAWQYGKFQPGLLKFYILIFPHVCRGLQQGLLQPYRIQVFRLGADDKNPFILIALQGEVFTEYGFNLAERLKPANTIVLGYSNHIAGYVCTAEAIKQGGYEPQAYSFWKTAGPYTTEAEAMILEAAVKLAKSKAR